MVQADALPAMPATETTPASKDKKFLTFIVVSIREAAAFGAKTPQFAKR
jgi:ABC-type hemin transport system substrate-binding protein